VKGTEVFTVVVLKSSRTTIFFTLVSCLDYSLRRENGEEMFLHHVGQLSTEYMLFESRK
jgi:hypothetical protein